MLHGFSVGSTGYISTNKLLFHSLSYAFTRLSGGMSLKQNYVARRMWSTSAKQIPKNLHSTICNISRSKQELSPQHQQKRRAHPPPLNQRPKGYHKRKRIYWNISKTIPICDK